MIDAKICDWLMDNADAPVCYRVARELLKDDKTAKKIENELFENKEVQKWLKNLKPTNPPQHRSMEHGSFDFCLENALPKVVQLGLHGGMEQVVDAVGFYVNPSNFNDAQLFLMANIQNEIALNHMLVRLNQIYDFTKQRNYDIYISEEEKKKLTGIPKNWQESKFIKPQLFKEGYSYPLIYDIVGMYRLYGLNNTDVDKKIDSIISYISTNEFHNKISDGYGILISGEYASGNPQYYSMGWEPKYPGWFDIIDYIENISAPKLLFFAEYISLYPSARKTKWFNDLLFYFEKYKTENGTYLFPKEWLKESPGYAVQGHHISFGENRRKKNWIEIESTFYMQLLHQNI